MWKILSQLHRRENTSTHTHTQMEDVRGEMKRENTEHFRRQEDLRKEIQRKVRCSEQSNKIESFVRSIRYRQFMSGTHCFTQDYM